MTDFNQNKSIARELERCVEELISYSYKNLSEEQSSHIHKISEKILELRQYFPNKELPKN